MPLEALAAVGLASNIVQFFDFLCKLFAEIGEIHSSATGLSETNADIETIAGDLKRLITRLSSVTTPSGSVTGQQLKVLADKITAVVDDLLGAIAEFKVNKPCGKWKSFVHAVHQRLGKVQKVEKIGSKLGKLQEQLNTQLLLLMRDQNSEVFQAIQNLIDESKRMESNTTQELRHVRDNVVFHIEQLDAKAVLYGIKVEDLLKKIGRLQSVSEHAVSELSTRMQKLIQALSAVQDETRSVSKNQRILRSLHFKPIAIRESKIPEAHARTFEWIFSEDNKDSTFLEWLQNDHGVFWAMGKAGSGKSALMKFLVNHPLTEQHLKSWAAAKTIVMAKYFFWNAISDLQKSQEGLLRSLLFTILRKCPYMISDLFSDLEPDLEDAELHTWDTQSLLKPFGILSHQVEPTTKFCFFIDDLDEYEGESSDLIKALRALSKLRMVKLCVSSRPWHVFKDEYVRPNYRMLKLEDLTRDDIALYVRDVLEEHERFDVLQQRDHRYQELVQ
ncbi:hypothetical protein BKA66DRAFT_580795 [Pyrenochaeta sp. MPI-SDFR-AT-0127]|nr:hypothetical protein BKA66DRAFT_580795 [Pyrenochaeta sp. MPI-SDFR-AT-0127]